MKRGSMNTYHIPAYLLAVVQTKIDKLIRRSRKLSMDCGIGLSVVNRYVKRDVKYLCPEIREFPVQYDLEMVEVAVTGKTPQLEGWQLLGVLEPSPNDPAVAIRRMVPGESLPDEYHNANPTHCEHCNHNRRRNKSFVLRHVDGGVKQVGSSCLQDFLGGKSPDEIVAYAEMLSKVEDSVSNDDESSYFGPKEPLLIHINLVLATTALCVRKIGWTSRTEAKDQDEKATANIVWELLTAKKDQRKLIQYYGLDTDRRGNFVGYDMKDSDGETAESVLRWVRDEMPVTNDYTHNLKTACSGDSVCYRTIGIACSAVAAYFRHLEKQSKSEVAGNQSNHVGAIKQRLNFAGTVGTTRAFDSAYGVRTMVKFVTNDGDVVVWWTGEIPDWVKIGECVEFTATVKAHSEYRGEKQTIVNRASAKAASVS